MSVTQTLAVLLLLAMGWQRKPRYSFNCAGEPLFYILACLLIPISDKLYFFNKITKVLRHQIKRTQWTTGK